MRWCIRPAKRVVHHPDSYYSYQGFQHTIFPNESDGWWALGETTHSGALVFWQEWDDDGRQWPSGAYRLLLQLGWVTLRLFAYRNETTDEWKILVQWRNAADDAWYEARTPTWIPAASFRGRWNLIVWKYDAANDTLSVSLNGGTEGQTTGVSGLKTATAVNSQMWLGHSAPYGYRNFSGAYTGFARWNRLLVADDIADLYNGGNFRAYADLKSEPGQGTTRSSRFHPQSL